MRISGRIRFALLILMNTQITRSMCWKASCKVSVTDTVNIVHYDKEIGVLLFTIVGASFSRYFAYT